MSNPLEMVAVETAVDGAAGLSNGARGAGWWKAHVAAAKDWEERHEAEWARVDQKLRGLAARRAALDAEEARLLRYAEEVKLWRGFGFGSLLEYMERAMGYAPHTAGERLRVARALAELPLLEDALERGALAHSAVRELTRVAVPDTEATWLEAAGGKSLRQIEAMVSGHRPGDLPTDETEPRLHRKTIALEVSPATYDLWRRLHALAAEEHGQRLSDDELIPALFRRAYGDGSRGCISTTGPCGASGAPGATTSSGAASAASVGASTTLVGASTALVGASMTLVGASATLVGASADSIGETAALTDVTTVSASASAVLVDVPAASVAMSANSVDVPAASVAMSANSVDVPAASVAMSANSVDVPAASVAMSANSVDVAESLLGASASSIGTTESSVDVSPPSDSTVIAVSSPAYKIAIKQCPDCKRVWQYTGGRDIEVEPAVLELAGCDAVHLGSLDAAVPERATSTVTPRKREQVLARDGHCCTVPGCRRNVGLDLHHIEYRSRGGGHDLANLTTICDLHHRAIHFERLVVGGSAPDGLAFEFRKPRDRRNVTDDDAPVSDERAARDIERASVRRSLPRGPSWG